jgi:hypothetical protein
MTALRETLIKIGAKVIAHARYASFEITEVATPCNLFADILGMTAKLRLAAVASTA